MSNSWSHAAAGTPAAASIPSAIAAGSVMTVTLSQHGIVSDAVNGLGWGVAAPSGAGQEAAINALIAASVAAAAASGAAGVKIIWDVAVALGAPVFLMSNMTVEAPHYGCGAIVRAGANCPIFMVNGMQANMNGGALTGVGAVATQNTFGMFDPAFQGSPNQQYHRVFNAAFVNANNLAILGGTWNGNYFQQTTQPPGTQGSLPFIVADNIGYTSIMHLFGVNGLTLRGLHCSNGTHFGLYFVNVANAVIEDCTVDQYQDRNYGSDAFHFGGPCQEIKIINPRTHCADDQIALNADDLGFNSTEGIQPGVNWQCSGAITDVLIQNHAIINGHENAIGWGAICFRSSVALIDRIVVNGVSGTTANWGIWAPAGWPALVSGPGNIGRITLRDLSFDVYQNQNAPAAIHLAVNCELVEIINRVRRSAQACPDIEVASGATIGTLVLSDYLTYQPAGAPNNGEPALVVNGAVGTLRMEGASLRDASIATSAAPLLQVGSTGSVGQAVVDVDAQGVSNIVTNAGTIGPLSLRGKHTRAGGGSPLANSGTVSAFILGSGSAPLMYSAGNVTPYSGTAPTAVNSYSEGTVTYATAYTTSVPANGVVGSAQTITFTPTSGSWPAGTTITPTASSGLTGTFSPTTVNASGASPVSVTFTPSATGSGTITSSASPAMTNTTGAQAFSATAASSSTLTTDKISTAPLIALSAARQLRAAYSGAAFQAVNSGGTTTNVGFSGTSVNQSTIAAVASSSGSNDSYVGTWYDQSGNGNNLPAASSTTQPRIAVAGTPVKEGSSPAFEMRNGTALLNTTTTPTGATISNAMTVFVVARAASGSSGVLVSYVNAGQTSYSNAASAQPVSSSNSPAGVGAYRNNVNNTVNTSAVNSLFAAVSSYDGTNSNFAVNRGSTSTVSCPGAFSGSGGFWVGAAYTGNGGTAFWNGTVCEVLVYPVALNSADIATLVNDMAAFYGTP